MSRAKKGLSYVLGDASVKENHILPINAMQFSHSRRQLYTAGRDGVVKVWSATEEPQDTESDLYSTTNSSSEQTRDIAETLLKFETSISSSPLPYNVPRSTFNSNVIKSYNVHFDWINDLKLVNRDRHLVSASADLSLKLIDIEGDERHVQKFQNVHTDYVKKISSIPSQNSLVSGGLDGKVVVWDISRLSPISEFENNSTGLNSTSSIYALSNDDGHLITTGGPNNTVNLYDRRISTASNANLIRKLVGHQDNVRCLLMNSNFVLSGSSDTTIKLWDLRNFSVYKNFDAHDDAVWNLCTAASCDPSFSSCPSSSLSDFREFYSGDKAGNIIKTDLNYLSIHNEYDGDDDDPYVNPSFTTSDQAYIDEQIGLCTLVAKDSSPIISLCVEGESSLFASYHNSLKRYHIPRTKNLAKYQFLRVCADRLEGLDKKYDDDMGQGLDSAGDHSDLDSYFYDMISQLSTDSRKIDVVSSFSGVPRLVTPQVQGIKGDLDSDAQYTSMFLNIAGGPSLEYVNAYKDSSAESFDVSTQSPFVDETPIEILLNPLPDDQVLTIPFNRAPLQEFMITPKSIISKKMFNNKRQLISLSVNGDITIWDVFICKAIEVIPFGEDKGLLKEDELRLRSEEMEIIFQQRQTDEVLSNWCEVYIRAGKLLVLLSESFISNTEIYYDELIKDYPFLKAQYVDNLQDSSKDKKDYALTKDTRFWLARIFLTSLFQVYCRYEQEMDKKIRECMREGHSNMKNRLPAVENEDEDGSKKRKPFSKIASMRSRSKASVSPSESLSSLSDDVTYYAEKLPSSAPDDSIAKMLLFNEHLYKEKYVVQGKKKCVDSILKLYVNEGTLKVGGENEYRPVIPSNQFPEDLLIIIYENSPELGNFRDLCSFHLSDFERLDQGDVSSDNSLVAQLRLAIPKWIGAPILYNRFSIKEQPKIAFQIYEVNYESLPMHKTINGKSQKKIKKLPPLETSIKLSSHCMLRVSKILQFLTEKFETKTPEMKMKKPAVEWLTLECKGRELDARMTLQTIKTTIWKSSSDIELYFHRKFD